MGEIRPKECEPRELTKDQLERQVIRLRRAKVLAKRSLKLRGAFGGSAHATRAQKGRAMG